MKMNKKGMTFEQIVLFILAIVVLLLIVSYFTGTFSRLQSPVDTVIGGVEAKLACTQLCSAKDQTGYDAKGCATTLGKDYASCATA